MSHVDDGRIHAWLDGALLPDDPERVALEAHLAECDACRARVEAERGIRDRSADILRTAAPDAVRVEPFESMIAARRARQAAADADAVRVAGEQVPGRVDSVAADTKKPKRRMRYERLAWAASLLMAVSAGWFARSLVPMGVLPARSPAESDLVATEALEEPEAALGAVAEVAAPPAGTPVAVPPGAAAQAAARGDAEEPGRAGFAERQETARTEAQSRLNQAEGGVRSTEETRRLADAITRDEARLQGLAATAPVDLVLDTAPLNEAGRAVLEDVRSAAWEPVTEEEAVARLGRQPARIEDLPVDSLQAALHDAGWVVRVFQRLESGEEAEVLQWNEAIALDQLVVTGEAERKALGIQAAVTADSAARRVAGDSALLRRERQAEVVAAAAPRPAAEPPADTRSMLKLKSLGFRVLVRADVSADSLAALAQRIR